MNKYTFLLICTMVFIACEQQEVSETLYESSSFTIEKNRVIQGENIATVVSPNHI